MLQLILILAGLSTGTGLYFTFKSNYKYSSWFWNLAAALLWIYTTIQIIPH